MKHEEMERITAATDVKSEKIRILFDAGVQRADIARFLNISYQHVQNVLKRSNRLDPPEEQSDAGISEDRVYTVKVTSGGRMVLPPDYIARHGIAEGETLICREEDGGLVIMNRKAAIALLQEIARRRMPTEAALLDALLSDQGKSG